MRTITLISCNDPAEAHLIQGRLMNAGIDCFLTNENMTTLAPHHNLYLNSGIQIMVMENDLAAARKLIKDKLEPVQEPLTCPNCGSTEIALGFGKRKTSKIFYIFIAIMAAMPFGNLKPKYFCRNCKTEIE